MYVVSKDQFGNPRCQCPDFDSTGIRRKHIYAAQFKVSLAVSFDGTVAETKTLTVVQKTTDKQDWPRTTGHKPAKRIASKNFCSTSAAT